MTAIKVCKFFIKSSPVGELQDVLDDISNIIGQDFLQNPEIKEALREYYETHKLHLQFQDGKTVLVTNAGRQQPLVKYGSNPAAQQLQQQQPPKKGGLFDGEDEEDYGNEEGKQEQVQEQQEQIAQEQQVEEFVYYDPVKKIKFSFHPITLEARIEEENADLESGSLPHNIVQLRNEVIDYMEAYLDRQFRKGTTQYGVFATDNQLRIEISCHNLNFKNFWGGEWLSNWTVDMNAQSIQGHIKVHNHYFEQGNIQFNMNKDYQPTKLTALNGKSIVEFINKNESNYQEGLEDMYNEVSEKLLKGMRRILPVTRTKFDWSRPNLV